MRRVNVTYVCKQHFCTSWRQQESNLGPLGHEPTLLTTKTHLKTFLKQSKLKVSKITIFPTPIAHSLQHPTTSQYATGCGVISATNHNFQLLLAITFDMVTVEKFQRYPLKASSNSYQCTQHILQDVVALITTLSSQPTKAEICLFFLSEYIHLK